MVTLFAVALERWIILQIILIFWIFLYFMNIFCNVIIFHVTKFYIISCPRYVLHGLYIYMQINWIFLLHEFF
jgi:hypothetical protein